MTFLYETQLFFMSSLVVSNALQTVVSVMGLFREPLSQIGVSFRTRVPLMTGKSWLNIEHVTI